MDIIDAIKTRKSIRKFTNEDVSIDKILDIINISANSPSGGNSQNWFCLIIKNKDILKKIRSETELVYKKVIGKEAPAVYTFFTDAPIVLAIVEKPYIGSIDAILEKTDKERNYIRKFIVNPGLQSVSSFITHILLVAHNEGLGACWMTGPLIAKQEIEKILEIDKPDNLVALIPIGNKIERQSKTARKDISEIIKIIK